MAAPASFNFADVWEAVAAQVPDRTALVCGDRRLSYADLEGRANQLAHHLAGAGVGPGDHVGLFLRNGTEYLEAMLAAFKLRAVPVNINHRYVADELRHLIDDSAAVALLWSTSLADAVAGLGAALGAMRAVVAVDDGVPAAVSAAVPVPGSAAYDDAIADQPLSPPEVDGRSGDDHYLIYTGGTTGRPKGVLWRQEDAFFACLGGGDPMRLQGPVARPGELLDRIIDGTFCYLSIAPLMHAAGQWVSLSWLFAGGRVVLIGGSLNPEVVWQTVQDEQANLLTMVGDAVGRPLLDAWVAHPGRWDASSLFALSNGGAPMSPSLKTQLSEAFGSVVLTDGFGSSETGAQGAQRLEPGAAGRGSGLARFQPYDDTAVFDDDLAVVAPGSGAIGRVARRGRIPLGYLNDPERTAATFVERAGERWVLTGDMATVDADGTIQLLGRGSQCINSGGEKVFPEEVEAALHAHPGIADVLVVGAPDERWGETVVAVAAPADGHQLVLEDLRASCRGSLAGYKLPTRLVVVDHVERSPAGKADYRWAKKMATGAEAGAAADR
ncbi:acyl-CoA synthetase [soil metagenome]